MKRDEAEAILNLPKEQTIEIILQLAEKADQFDRLQGVSPTTPSGMTPTYLKPNKSKRKKKPGRKKGHRGAFRKPPQTVHEYESRTLDFCPCCHHKVDKPIKSYKRTIEDIPPVETKVTEYTLHGYWCSKCRKIVYAKTDSAMPDSKIGIRAIIYSAWLHYFVGISVRNVVKILLASSGLKVSPGGLTQAWKSLSLLLDPYYRTIRQKVKTSGVLHADETGWRINGSSHWLWCFANKQFCYYVITKSRGSPVIHKVLGKIFKGILICDFFGAYNMIEAFAKQRCFYHLATELEKTDKHNLSDQWQKFRKKLYRLMKDAIRLSAKVDSMEANRYVQRIERLYTRLDCLIDQSTEDPDVNRLQKRLSRHRNELFTFLECIDVSPYNNWAEQQMRRPVISRKISQQNRSADGATAQAILMSVFKTLDLQKLNPVEAAITIAQSCITGNYEKTIDVKKAS